jgi:hypothetical protein
VDQGRYSRLESLMVESSHFAQDNVFEQMTLTYAALE